MTRIGTAGSVPALAHGIEPLHELARELFTREAAIMRGYAYWVPCVTSLGEKLSASHLVYLHMRCAEDLHRLIGLLRVPPPTEVYSPKAVELTSTMQRFSTFGELRAGISTTNVLEHRTRIRALLASAPRLFDYYVLETLSGIERRYVEEILPTLAGDVGV